MWLPHTVIFSHIIASVRHIKYARIKTHFNRAYKTVYYDITCGLDIKTHDN